MEKKDIEIPFGAFDSELGGFEYTIPEGYKAEIKDGKVIVRKTEFEDERIRKELIAHFKTNSVSESWSGLNVKKVIAWLEKQGNLMGALQEANKKIGELVEENYYLKEQGEQKPADNIESSAFKDKLLELFQKLRYIKEGVPTNGDIIDYVDAHIQELIGTIQNKPAWSEEDEKMLKDTIRFCELCGNQVSADWLKSLRPQNNITDEELAQAKKDAYNDVLDKLEYDNENPTFDDGWSAAIWYLKKRNAQPQNRWKPSDEQMEVIEAVINNRSFQRRHLDSLYNDLKKLKG